MKPVLSTLLLLHIITLTAQVKPLSIGDKVPDIQFTILQNGNPQPTTLSAFKGKLLILDFWATWCTNCIKKFPALSSLKEEYPQEMDVVLITAESSAKVQHLFARLGNQVRPQFPVLANDTVFAALFPHTILPHYVWLSEDRRVIAITGAEELTAKNIRQLLSRNDPQMQNKTDRLNVDVTKPLLGINTISNNDMHSSFVFAGHMPGLGARVGRYTDTASSLQRRYFINQPLRKIYELAAPDIPPFRIQGVFPANSKYSCEITLPLQASQQQWQARMIAGLDAGFGLRTQVAEQLTDCFVLKLKEPRAYDSSIQGVQQFRSVSVWLKALNLQPWVQNECISMINETGLGNTPVFLPDPAGLTIQSLSAKLAQLGFSLTPATRCLNWITVTPMFTETTNYYSPKTETL